MELLKEILTSKKLYIWLGSLIILGASFILVMDKVLMPGYTNYNQAVTVPDVTKISLTEARELLESYGLRHEILDRRNHSAYPADYIIDQAPSPLQLVKPNRKIYLTVNTAVVPTVTVPNVQNMSLRNAQIQLENYGLRVGQISYESSRFRNTVLRQSIEAGSSVITGSVVDLAVSDGLGDSIVQVPEIIGLRLPEAQQKIREAGLRVEEIRFQPVRDVPANTVMSFTPNVRQLREGEVLNLVVSERFDAREASETGVVLSDTLDTVPPDSLQNNPNPNQ